MLRLHQAFCLFSFIQTLLSAQPSAELKRKVSWTDLWFDKFGFGLALISSICPTAIMLHWLTIALEQIDCTLFVAWDSKWIKLPKLIIEKPGYRFGQGTSWVWCDRTSSFFKWNRTELKLAWKRSTCVALNNYVPLMYRLHFSCPAKYKSKILVGFKSEFIGWQPY